MAVTLTQQANLTTAHGDNLVSNGHSKPLKLGVEACSLARCRRSVRISIDPLSNWQRMSLRERGIDFSASP
jgi:hypothetical protein